ncbi:MAG TPA: IS4 family transposase, partial [Bacteroidia bacterium]|nr:IS4 family transposase [Bacteroidia bacterium]
PSFCTSAFCRARQRLSEGFLEAVESRLAMFAEARIEGHHRWRGWRVKLVDGTSVQLADTAANQAEYPQPSAQKPGCGFPVMGVVALLDVALGTVVDYLAGPSHGHDLEGLRRLLDRIKAKDLLVADRAFCSWEMLAILEGKGAGCVMRLHQKREAKLDWRRGRKLDEDSRIVEWSRPAKPGKSGITRATWERLADTMKVRLVRFEAPGRDGRPRTIYLATTLLDEKACPTEEIAGLYAQRWSIEVRFRDLKTTMGLERFRVRTPEMARKTLRMAVIAYNLVKLLQLEASRGEAILADEIGFKGTLDVLVEFRGGFIGLANRPRLLEREREEVLARIRERLLFIRPGRSEPRAVKARPKAYPCLTTFRGDYVEIQHRSRYRKAA